jgi:hypothetical protein
VTAPEISYHEVGAKGPPETSGFPTARRSQQAPGQPVDLLAQAIERTRPLLADITRPPKERIRVLWAAAKMARDLGAWDVVHDAFMQLAVEVHLIDSNGWWTGEDVRESVRRYGAEDVAHAIRWALRGWNPFEEGALE